MNVLRQSGGRVDWSADNVIVFDRLGPDDFYDVAVMNPDGSGERCITCDKPALPNKHIGNPAWHPSGAFIVFQAQKSAAVSVLGNTFFSPGSGISNDVWVTDRDGNRFWQLTNVDLRVGGVLHPHFSHSGNKLLWSERISNRGRYGEWVLKLADFSVSAGVPRIDNVTSLQPGVQRLFYESHGFTPDDSAIIFSGNLEPGLDEFALDIYRMTLATGEVTNLTATADQWDEHAHISPSGRHIVWMSSAGSNRPINPAQLRTDYWIMRADGSSKTRLTYFNQPGHAHALPEGGVAGDFAWSPDGNRLVAYVIESGAPPGSVDRLIEDRNTRIAVIELDGVTGIETETREEPIDPPPTVSPPPDEFVKTEPQSTELSLSPATRSQSDPAMDLTQNGRAPSRTLVTAMPGDTFELRNWDRHLDALIRARELERISVANDPLLPDRRHERFVQLVRGVRVYGGGATRQTQNGATQSIFVAMHAADHVDTNPRLTGAEATAALMSSFDAPIPQVSRPELVLVDTAAGLRLAYHWRIVSSTDIRSYFADAHSGQPVLSFSDVQARTLSAPASVSHPGAGPVNILAEQVFQYLLVRFNHRGLANGPAGLTFLHADNTERPGPSPAALYRRAPFYAGNGTIVLAGAETTPDVIAHEVAHAVIDGASRLVYRGEAGALNEAFADVIAASSEAMRGRHDSPSAAALAAPSAFGRLDHYVHRSDDTDAGGFIQAHAGIAGHAFHLAVHGGTHRTSGVSVTGVGASRRHEIERAFYRAFAYLLPPGATFAVAKIATVRAAQELYGHESDAARAIRAAWEAAGL